MIERCKVGDTKVFKKEVLANDLAKFSSGEVHPFYSTFAIGRDMEYASRLFVLEIIQDDEEGIGTSLQIDHLSPAVEGEVIEVVATVKSFVGNELLCDIQVKAGHRLIATGITGQKILKRTKIAALLEEIEKNGG